MSMTPPPTPPLGVVGGDEGLLDSDGLEGESEDFIDFILADPGPPHPQNKEVIESYREEPDWFSCKGEIRWGSEVGQDSYLGQGVLSRLLQHLDPCPTTLPIKAVFHLPCTPDNIHLHLSHFFMALRQVVVDLEKGAQSNFTLNYPGATISASSYPEVRQNCVAFLSALASCVYGAPAGEEAFLRKVVDEVVQTLIFLGPMHELPHHVITAASTQGNKCPSAAYHLLHLHLDVRWWSLILLHMAELTLGPITLAIPMLQEPPRPPQGAGDGVEGDPQSTLQQCVSMVVWDLVTLMTGSGLKKGVSELYEEPGFSCSCGLELAVMMMHFIDHRHTRLAQQSFWEEVKNKLLVILKMGSESSSPSATPSFPPGPSTLLYPSALITSLKIPHVWWLFINFSKLYVYDVQGKKLSDKEGVKSEVKLLRTLLRLSLGDPRGSSPPTELELRFFLRCCLGLLGVWGGSHSSEWAATLWDYMAKNLNSAFLLPGAGLEGLACVSKTAGGWLEQVRSRVCDPAVVGRSETSWQIFLRIVVGVVQSGPLEWRQIRGRIFSKFHGRKMSELNPTGLYNTVSLFLTLASTTDTLNVINKLGELLSLVPVASLSKSRVVWRSLLAAALLLVEKGCEVTLLAERLSSLVNTACHQHTTTRDPQHKRELGQLLILYAEGVQEVFEHSSDLSLAQHSLICASVAGVLPHVGAAELKVILECMDAALTKVLYLCAHPESVVAGMVGSSVVEVVWKEYGPFLRSHSSTLTPPQVVASLAASLTLCLAQMVLGQTSTHRDAATGLLQYFLTHEAVNPGCSLHYASCLLTHPGSMAVLSSLHPGHEKLLVCAWLCGLIAVGGKSEAVEALTPQIASLLRVIGVLPPHPPTDPYAITTSFIRGVANKFSSLETFADRAGYREEVLQYFSGLDRAVGSLLKKTPPSLHLPQALNIVADLFFYAHSVIYIKSKPTCLLANLLSTVLLPTHIYSPEKPLVASVASNLATVLPKLVCGVGRLGLAQDPYLLRCVRAVFTHYLHRFPVKTTHNYTITMHPFLATLHHGDVKKQVLEELRMVFLEVVRDNYLARRGTSPLHLQVALALLAELLHRNIEDWLERMCSFLLLPLLELLLTIEEQTTKRLATDLLQKVLQEAQEQGVPPRKVLVGHLQDLVGRHMSWSSARLFRVLSVVGVLHRPLLLDTLPHITRAVTLTEEKRGTGLDHTLRQGYQSLLSSLKVADDGTT